MRIIDIFLLSRYEMKGKEVKFHARAFAWSLLGITFLSIVIIALNSLAPGKVSGFDFSYVLHGLSLLLLFALARGWLRAAGMSMVVMISLIMVIQPRARSASVMKSAVGDQGAAVEECINRGCPCR